MNIPSVLLPALVAFAPLSAGADQLLVKFDGGIGAIGVMAALAADGTGPNAATVTRNIVRGVQPPNTPWVIADLKAEVKVDGHIKVDGRGLVFAGGDTIGTAIGTLASGANPFVTVFATLICATAAPFTQLSTEQITGVPLAENGDFKIDDVLFPPPPAPSSCATPVLLIRNAGNKNWFAAGIPKFE